MMTSKPHVLLMVAVSCFALPCAGGTKLVQMAKGLGDQNAPKPVRNTLQTIAQKIEQAPHPLRRDQLGFVRDKFSQLIKVLKSPNHSVVSHGLETSSCPRHETVWVYPKPTEAGKLDGPSLSLGVYPGKGDLDRISIGEYEDFARNITTLDWHLTWIDGAWKIKSPDVDADFLKARLEGTPRASQLSGALEMADVIRGSTLEEDNRTIALKKLGEAVDFYAQINKDRFAQKWRPHFGVMKTLDERIMQAITTLESGASTAIETTRNGKGLAQVRIRNSTKYPGGFLDLTIEREPDGWVRVMH